MGGHDVKMRPSIAADRIKNQRGVTLPEMLVVLAIIGMFVVVTLPALGNYIRASRVRVSNDVLMEDLRAARYIAITNHTTDSVTFDQAAGTYRYTDIRGALVVRRLESGVSFSSLTNTPITFTSDGSLSTSAPTIVILGTVMSGTSHQYTISVTTVGRSSSVFAKV